MSQTSQTQINEEDDGTMLMEAPMAGGGMYPPYAPYQTEPVPPTIADAIVAGREIRVKHKSRRPARAACPPPRPAKPRTPKVTDVPNERLPARKLRAHAACMRKHNIVLTDRLEQMSKPKRRTVIDMWRDHKDKLSIDAIARLRGMLDADEPFKPDQAYEYFTNLKKSSKKNRSKDWCEELRRNKKDLMALAGDRRFSWARNATVAFARGIVHRLSKPAKFSLQDRMLRLSDIVLDDLACYMHTRRPPRRCTRPKGRFMVETADKIAVWIDEILSEADDRMLMMDFDEDDEEVQETDGGASPTHSAVTSGAATPTKAGSAAAPPTPPPPSPPEADADPKPEGEPALEPAPEPAPEPAATPAEPPKH